MGIRSPRTVLEVEKNDSMEIELGANISDKRKETKHEIEEIQKYTRRILNNLNKPGAKISVFSHPPRHHGFGSTTQLSISLGLGIYLAYGEKTDPIQIMKILGKTSAGGVHTLRKGGLVVSGGFAKPRGKFQLSEGEEFTFPPLILRKKFPKNWRFVVSWPRETSPGPSGKVEEKAFEKLQSLDPPRDLIKEAHFLLNTQLIPAVTESNSRKFGEALTKIQTIVGELYSPIQRDTFNPVSKPLIDQLSACENSLGVGQSSWGPAVYSFVADKNNASKIAKKTREEVDAEIHIVEPDNRGWQFKKLESS